MRPRDLADLGHELRTPLSGILGLADLLLETPIDLEQKTYIEAIRSSGGALIRMIDDLLSWSRIEAGRLTLAAEPFDVRELAESVVELLAPLVVAKGLEVASSIAGDVPVRVVGDPLNLRQILINLIGNAIKFTERGHIALRVVSPCDGKIRFEVSDTGPGIPLKWQGAIFEDYVRVEEETASRDGGAGLGLPISKRIAEAMGGSILLATEEGRGSTFSVELPLCRLADEPDWRSSFPDLSQESVLVATPSALQGNCLKHYLAEAGAEVHVAGTEALAASFLRMRGITPPKIVILDAALGESSILRLDELAGSAGTSQRLLLAAPGECRAIAENPNLRFDGLLTKPVRFRMLFSCVGSSGTVSSKAAREELGPKLRILLAEDDDVSAAVVTRLLSRLGMNVTRVSDGRAAIDCVARHLDGAIPGFDAVLLDLRLAGLGGWEAARRIRQAERAAGKAKTLLIGLTAGLRDENHLAEATAGFDEILMKPIDPHRMRDILLRHFVDKASAELGVNKAQRA
jgi:CheY-like chemotaxis protein